MPPYELLEAGWDRGLVIALFAAQCLTAHHTLCDSVTGRGPDYLHLKVILD